MESAPNSGTRVGYTRLSTVAQTLDQQNTALAAAGVTKTVRSLNPTINICLHRVHLRVNNKAHLH